MSVLFYWMEAGLLPGPWQPLGVLEPAGWAQIPWADFWHQLPPTKAGSVYILNNSTISLPSLFIFKSAFAVCVFHDVYFYFFANCYLQYYLALFMSLRFEVYLLLLLISLVLVCSLLTAYLVLLGFHISYSFKTKKSWFLFSSSLFF